MQRRHFLITSSLAGFADQAGAALTATPGQTEGPFYPLAPIPLQNDLVNHGGGIALGEHLVLSGTVRGTSARALPDALIEIWQCDAAGNYRHPRANPTTVDPHFAGFGANRTSATGQYHFNTLMPVPYTGRPPHIHVKVHIHTEERLTTQIYLAGQTEEGGLLATNSTLIGDRTHLTINPVLRADLYQAIFDFVVS